MITIISSDNVVTRTSKNLRGVMDHSHHHGKSEVTITDQRDGSAQCYLRWANADCCHVHFASAAIAENFFNKVASKVTRHAPEP